MNSGLSRGRSWTCGLHAFIPHSYIGHNAYDVVN